MPFMAFFQREETNQKNSRSQSIYSIVSRLLRSLGLIGSRKDINHLFSNTRTLFSTMLTLFSMNLRLDSPNLVVERREVRTPTAPVAMNAFELISTSQGLSLSSLFEKQMGLVKRETRFSSKCPANEIISKIEQATGPMGFDVTKNNYKTKEFQEKEDELVINNKGYDGAKRITIAEVLGTDWFNKGYKPPVFEHKDVILDDVNSIFNESTDSPNLVERREVRTPTAPVAMNAFELISTSQGLNLSSLFEKQMGLVKRETRFTSKCPANEIISKIEQASGPIGFNVTKNNYKLKLHGKKSGRKGLLSIATEFYKNLATGLKDIVWNTGDRVKVEVNNGVEGLIRGCLFL
ncbi:CBL-interacting serine/threonine-protein kinase 23 [Orobanche gracilis]